MGIGEFKIWFDDGVGRPVEEQLGARGAEFVVI
jgi:hypothetical protein